MINARISSFCQQVYCYSYTGSVFTLFLLITGPCLCLLLLFLFCTIAEWLRQWFAMLCDNNQHVGREKYVIIFNAYCLSVMMNMLGRGNLVPLSAKVLQAVFRISFLLQDVGDKFCSWLSWSLFLLFPLASLQTSLSKNHILALESFACAGLWHYSHSNST